MTLANGPKIEHRGRLTNLKVGDFQNAGLQIADGGKHSRIGLKYLRRFHCVLDFGRNRIYLKKGAEFDVPDKESNVGVGVLRKSGRTIIAFVQPNKSGHKAGLQLNDELISVAEIPVNDKSMGEVRWMFRERADANGQLVLKLRRDGIDRDVTLTIDK